MHIPLRIPTHGRPPAPGELLLEEFLRPMGITQRAFAERIGVPYERLSGVINGRRAVSVDTAMRIGRALGTSADMWVRAQLAVDLYDAQHGPGAAAIAAIKPLTTKAS
jgi:addiction module HigA family antidote